jgi:hypothetical protein
MQEFRATCSRASITIIFWFHVDRVDDAFATLSSVQRLAVDSG